MNLKHLTDQNLLTQTMTCAKREKQALVDLLFHLREVDRRRLYSSLKHPSMFEYVVKDLNYSEPEAIRRISAMRLMRDIPQIEQKVKSGELSLTNMVLAQTMFSKERKVGRNMGSAQKYDVMRTLENCSTREAQRIVQEISPEMRKAAEPGFESIQDDGLREKMLRLTGLLAHSNPGITPLALMHKLCDDEIERLLPSAPKVEMISKTKRKDPVRDRQSTDVNLNTPITQNFAGTGKRKFPTQIGSRRTSITKQVWARDKHKCVNCNSTYALEIDHIVPRAMGGTSGLENLRLLCRACNQRAAIEKFGMKKMAAHVREKFVAYRVP